MDTNKLFKAIQIIVQEEVKKEVAKQQNAIRESILKEIKLTSVQKRTPVSKPLDTIQIVESQTSRKKSGPKFEGKFASLLNETANDGEWRSINSNSAGGAFNSTHAAAWGGLTETPNILQSAEGRAIPIEQLQKTDAGQAVVNALTRDYSSLMKAIDSKKGR